MTFHNIFSSKKENAPQKPAKKIIIDIHEKNSLVPSELSSLSIPFEFQHLKIADYIINNIAIERKTINDLKSSIINKRIFSQIQELKQYPTSLLIIEAVNEEMYQGIIHENALRGFLLSILLDHKVPIVFTKNEKDTAKYLSILAKKKDEREISIRPSKLFLSKEQQIQYILEGFPHIGPVKAKALLKKFSSLKNIINASESELQKILGKNEKEFKELIVYTNKQNN